MSPRTKEQNDAIREIRMNQIMQAAAEVYLEKGIQLEIRDVAVKAELGYGTVYHYYKNKQMLLEDLLWDALNRTESAVQPALTGRAAVRMKLSRSPGCSCGSASRILPYLFCLNRLRIIFITSPETGSSSCLPIFRSGSIRLLWK